MSRCWPPFHSIKRKRIDFQNIIFTTETQEVIIQSAGAGKNNPCSISDRKRIKKQKEENLCALRTSAVSKQIVTNL